jgi:hypothetical protein
MEMVTRDRHFAGGVVYTSSLALVRKRSRASGHVANDGQDVIPLADVRRTPAEGATAMIPWGWSADMRRLLYSMTGSIPAYGYCRRGEEQACRVCETLFDYLYGSTVPGRHRKSTRLDLGSAPQQTSSRKGIIE